MYTSRDVAAWFVGRIDRQAGDSITPLKLQKLLYYAQAWALVLLDRPLFDEDFEAWKHGPVLKSVYREYRHLGFDAIPASSPMPGLDPETVRVLEDVQRVYGERSASALEHLTHQEAPWRDARGATPPDEPSDAVIPRDAIRDFYRRMFMETGGALAPHREWFEAANPPFLGPDGQPMPPPDDVVFTEDDWEFNAVLEAGLRGIGPRRRRTSQGGT